MQLVRKLVKYYINFYKCVQFKTTFIYDTSQLKINAHNSSGITRLHNFA